jgi:hypothetical protein
MANGGPGWRMVGFGRRYPATGNTRSGSSGPGVCGAPVGDGVTAAGGDRAHRLVELGRAQSGERVDQLLPGSRESLHAFHGG